MKKLLKILALTIACAASAQAVSLGNLGWGVTANESASGTGYILFSPESLSGRLTLYPNQAEKFIAVYYSNGTWYYYNDESSIAFTPLPSDVLVAQLDYSADTATLLNGQKGKVHGIQTGYVSGDLGIIVNQWNGVPDPAEFTVTGSYVTLNMANPTVAETPTGYSLQWSGLPDNTYFIEYSTDLQSWSFFPEIEHGTGAFDYGFTSSTDKIFLRLQYTGMPTNEPFSADFDSDGISNWDEVRAGGTGTSPLNSDSDGDGVLDGLDSNPVVNFQSFEDADGDGIPDHLDSEPNNPRGDAPAIAALAGHSDLLAFDMVEGDSVNFLIRISNPDGPSAPVPGEIKLMIDGVETSSVVTDLGDGKFAVEWTAQLHANYPQTLLQNLYVEFVDGEGAIAYQNLRAVDVAEWEGKIVAVPFVDGSDPWQFDILTHSGGVHSSTAWVNRVYGTDIVYRGPQLMSVADTNGNVSQIQLGNEAIPYFVISSQGNTPNIVSQSDYASLLTGMHVEQLLYNGSSSSIRFDLSQVGINQTLNSGQSNQQQFGFDGTSLPFSTTASLEYLSSGTWQPFYASTWNLVNVANANTRILRTRGVYNNNAGQLKVHSATNYMQRGVKITSYASGTIDHPGLPQESVTDAYQTKYMFLSPQEWRKIKIDLYPRHEHFTYSNGYRLNLRAGADGVDDPQAGWEVKMMVGGVLTPLTIPADGRIDITSTSNTSFYDEIKTSGCLELFVKGGSLVDTRHVVGLDALPKVAGNNPDKMGELDLIPVEVAPNVLAVNSDFDEGRIDPVTGYAIPDCDDVPGVDRKTGVGNGELLISADRDHLDGNYSDGDRITEDLHEGWFGAKPKQFDDAFWNGATVTIRKLDRVDPETGRKESGQVRFYAKWGETYYGINAYDFNTLQPNNLVTGGVNKRPGEGVYGSTSTIPDNAEFWMEGVRPGKITLEWRLQKGGIDKRYEQTFLVATHKSKQEWIDEVYYQIKLQSTFLQTILSDPQYGNGFAHPLAAFPIDFNQFDPNNGLFLPNSRNYVYIQTVYYYYRQLFRQNPEKLYWAGMAKTAGASVYAGMVDMNTWKTYVFSDEVKINQVLNDFMIQGNKSIFLDMAWAHHAYASSGIWALDYLKKEQTDDGSLFNNPLTDYEGWEAIDEGTKDSKIASLREGNRNILRREQQTVMQPLYNTMKTINLDPGTNFEQYLATNVAGISYPPTNAAGEINVDEMFTINGRNPLARDTGVKLRDITPNGLLSNFDHRWAWIDNAQKGMLQIWLGTSTIPAGYNANQRSNWNMTPLKTHALFYSMLPSAGNFNSLQFPPSW